MVKNFTAEEIIQYISDAKKATPIKVYINGEFSDVQF
ncbi:2,3,4,5-tetrahydropyridine-2,6-dicarboxylate N-acetyltransferase, partial [Staphylococcus pseudintermedius]